MFLLSLKYSLFFWSVSALHCTWSYGNSLVPFVFPVFKTTLPILNKRTGDEVCVGNWRGGGIFNLFLYFKSVICILFSFGISVVSNKRFELHAVHFNQVWHCISYSMCRWIFVTVCSSWSNLKQQRTFILPRAALNITQLGSGQSGTFPASTFPREQKNSNGQADKVQHFVNCSGMTGW